MRVLNSILNGWQDVEQAVDSATNSYGSAEKENKVFMESIQGRLNTFATEFQKVAQKTISGDFIKGVVSFGAEILKLINVLGGFIPILIAIGTIISGYKSSTLMGVVASLITKFTNLKMVITATGIAINGTALSINALTAALTAGLSIAIMLAVAAFKHFNTTLQEQQEKVASLKSEYESIISEIQSLEEEQEKTIDRMKELNSIEAPTLADKAELEKLKEANDELERQIALKKIAKGQADDDLNKAIVDEYQMSMVDTKNRASLHKTAIRADTSGIYEVPDDISTNEYALELIDEIGRLNTLKAQGVKLDDKQAQSLSKYRQELAVIGVEYGNFIQDYDGDNQELVNFWKDLHKQIFETLSPSQYQLDQFKEIFNAEEFSDTKDKLLELAQAGQLDPKISSGYKEFQDLMNETGLTAEELVTEINNMVVASGEGVEETIKDFETLRSSTNSVTSSAKNLSSAFKEQKENGSLSADTMMSMVDAGYAAALAIDAETGAVTLNAKMYQFLLEVKLAEQEQSLSVKKDALIAELKKEEKAVIGLTDEYEKKAKMQALAEGVESLAAIDTQIAAIRKIKSSISDITAGTYGVSKSADSIPKAFQDAYNELQYLRDRDLIDEATYYNRLEALSNQFFAKGSENWRKYDLEIYKGRQEIPKAFQKAYAEIQYMRDTSVISEKEYLDRLYVLNEKYNKANLENWRKYDQELQQGRQALLEKSLKQQGDAYVKVISRQIKDLNQELKESNDYYDRRIDSLNDQLKESNDLYDKKIDKLKEQKDAITSAANEETRLLNIEKARIALAKAQSQKTKKVFREGEGFVWEVDQTAVADAQENLNNLMKEYANLKATDAIDKQIKALEDAKKASADSINSQIDNLKDLKESSAESIQSQIEDLENLKDNFQEKMDLIGITLEDHQTNLELMAAASALSFDEMASAAEDYADRVEAAMSRASSAQSSSRGSGGSGNESYTDLPGGGREVTIRDSNGNIKGYRYETADEVAWSNSIWHSGRLDWIEGSGDVLDKGSNSDSDSIWLKGRKATGDKRIRDAGIYNVDEEGLEAILGSPSKGRYQWLGEDSVVFKSGATENLWNFANNPVNFIAKQLGSITGAGSRLQLAAPSGRGSINVEKFVFGDLSLPNVKDANSFVNELKNISIDAVQYVFKKK